MPNDAKHNAGRWRQILEEHTRKCDTDKCVSVFKKERNCRLLWWTDLHWMLRKKSSSFSSYYVPQQSSITTTDKNLEGSCWSSSNILHYFKLLRTTEAYWWWPWKIRWFLGFPSVPSFSSRWVFVLLRSSSNKVVDFLRSMTTIIFFKVASKVPLFCSALFGMEQVYILSTAATVECWMCSHIESYWLVAVILDIFSSFHSHALCSRNRCRLYLSHTIPLTCSLYHLREWVASGCPRIFQRQREQREN